METKKNKKATLERFRFIFFQTGLVIALGFVLVAFEWSSTLKQYVFKPVTDVVVEDFVIPNTFFKEAKPEQPRVNKQKIAQSMTYTSVPDNTNIEPDGPENPVEPNTDNLNPIILPDENIVDDAPVHIAEHAAHTKKCASLNEEQRRICTYEELNKILGKNLKYPADMKRAGISGTVHLRFVINKEGEVDNIEILRSPHEQFSKEAIRVVKLFPEMYAAKQNGRAVSQYYTLPIKFELKKE